MVDSLFLPSISNNK